VFNLREAILKENSRKQCDIIVAWVGNDQKRFDELFLLFTTDDYRLVQNSSWPMGYCVDAHPQLLKKHFGKLVKQLQNPAVHNAVKRNTTRILQNYSIPEKHKGTIMHLCFTFIENINEKAAVKAFSLTILQNLAKEFPEILPEIKLIVQERWAVEGSAFRSRGKYFLK
jgi:hypothetical protein